MNYKESLEILRRRFQQKNILLVSGNVYDTFQKYEKEAGKLVPRTELTSLVEILKNISIQELDYSSVEYWRPLEGAKDLITNEAIEGNTDILREYITKLSNDINNKDDNAEGKVHIIDLSDIYLSNNNGGDSSLINEVSELLSAILVKESKTSTSIVEVKKNTKVIFIMRDHGNVLNDLTSNNYELAMVNVALPDIDERSDFLKSFARKIGTTDVSDLKNPETKVHKNAIVSTSGMSYKEILQLGRILEDKSYSFKELLNMSKFNKVKSEWEKLDWDRVKNVKDELAISVKGQEFAIDNVARVLQNALLGLNGVMLGENNKKPKGILFFAGPTGVGKTELAKSITEFVFGDKNRMIRFDMSEFSQEHSDQRLIGAPPGYVGYDGGGELTNAVRNNPQSIILFDEVEKAHGKILDKFLQILEDGRLTSAQGETIDFSETMIIFTSNIGADKSSPDKTNEDNRKLFINGVKDKFKSDLGRPEILNRIGEHNIIPFNYITDKKILKSIFTSKLEKLKKGLIDKNKIKIFIEQEDETPIFEIIENNYDKTTGGRGLISAIETQIQYPLTKYLFEHAELVKNKEITNLKMTYNGNKIIFEKIQ